jgi:hypothetical protein
MKNEQVKCAICGGAMQRVKVLPLRVRHLIRFRCSSGHCEDFGDGARAASGNGHRASERE